MPQAPQHLQDLWEDDGAALEHLRPNFTCKAGMLQAKEGYTPTDKDFSAVDYLILEWDYGYFKP